MTTTMRASFTTTQRFLIDLAVITIAVAAASTLAGSLTPSESPASTLRTPQEVYDTLVGTFGASAVTGSATGNAMQLSQCAITKLQGGSCS